MAKSILVVALGVCFATLAATRADLVKFGSKSDSNTVPATLSKTATFAAMTTMGLHEQFLLLSRRTETNKTAKKTLENFVAGVTYWDETVKKMSDGKDLALDDRIVMELVRAETAALRETAEAWQVVAVEDGTVEFGDLKTKLEETVRWHQVEFRAADPKAVLVAGGALSTVIEALTTEWDLHRRWFNPKGSGTVEMVETMRATNVDARSSMWRGAHYLWRAHARFNKIADAFYKANEQEITTNDQLNQKLRHQVAGSAGCAADFEKYFGRKLDNGKNE